MTTSATGKSVDDATLLILVRCFQCPTNYPRGILVSKLGKADKTWEPRPCPMCSLMAAVRPDLARDLRVLEAEDAAECELRAFSSNEAWLHFHDSPHRLSNWVDTVFLGLVPAERGRVSAHPRSGFIGRVGSNDNFGGQVIDCRPALRTRQDAQVDRLLRRLPWLTVQYRLVPTDPPPAPYRLQVSRTDHRRPTRDCSLCHSELRLVAVHG